MQNTTMQSSNIHHPWQVTPAQAWQIQTSIAQQAILQDEVTEPGNIVGVDVGFHDKGTLACAAAVVFSWPGLNVIESKQAYKKVEMPYVPGLLSFRELPAILEALNELSTGAGLILCDGQGFAHPRRCGIATHLGVLTGYPTIGVGKTRLLGEHAEVAPERGATQPLIDKGERIGTVLRSRSNVSPLYISPGHRLHFASAADWVLSCCTSYKIPQPIRAAHRLASENKQ
ncbi:endonuclease V [Halorhodospira halochloris]|uniref:Endonuclease V n=2 Tax=Halorhodospira halochloris TaxID=1052 RepID=A0A110B191_HALHR|nr:deoxyribonuclease V [Halorhodospira halochloris]BAU56845.1 endonuclease V [Halorhodospira halochloris]